jgi:hypothetical protein
VSREAVDACVSRGVFERPPIENVRYAAFVDPSGGSSDSMTLAIAHREKDVIVLDCVRERRAPFSPEAVVTEFANTLKAYRITSIRGDGYGGEWPRERFKKCGGIEYFSADKPKSEIYLAVLPAIMSGKVDLLDNARLVGQFAGLERRTGRGGRDSVDHRAGARDDLCNSAAGVVHALLRAGFDELLITSWDVTFSFRSPYAHPTNFGEVGSSGDTRNPALSYGGEYLT